MPESDTAFAVETAAKPRRLLHQRAFGRLLSATHFDYKVLSGAAVALVVILFLSGLLLFVALRAHWQDEFRAHSVEVIRLSAIVENDIAELESYHRGYLLMGAPQHRVAFERQSQFIDRRLEQLAEAIKDEPIQRKRLLKARELVLRWINQTASPALHKPSAPNQSSAALGRDTLDEAREILQSLQDEEQIALNRHLHGRDWATQSAQMLDFLPKLERAVIEMEKEKQGFLLTGDNSFVEAHRRSSADFYTYYGYLSILMANTPAQAQLLSDLRAKVEQWMSSFATPEIEAKRNGRDIRQLVASDSDDQLIREVQDTLAELHHAQLGNYQEQMEAAARQRIWRTSALALLALLAVLLLVCSNAYSFLLVRRHVTKLEAAEVRIRAIIESILDGMIILDRSGTIRLMNPAAERMFGCANNEMLGQKFTKLVPKAYAADGHSQLIEWDEFTRRTGTTALAIGRTRQHVTFPVDISLSQLMVDRTICYVAMARDVTERQRFEREIAAEKESLAVTLRSIGDGVITTNVQGRVSMINHAAETLTGWSNEEATGQPLKTVFKLSIDLSAQVRAHRAGYRNEAQSILLNLPENATLICRDGSERLIEQVVSPIRDRRNEIAGVVLVFRDITARERSENERRKAEALEQLGLLAGGIAHDFNNLLTAIVGNISLASLLVPVSDEMGKRLADAKNASLRARDLAQQLLTFARGGAPIKKTASIARLVQDTVSFSLRGSQSRSNFSIAPDLWSAEIDSGQISQVIANLVVNADQSMANGGTLHVSCQNYRHSAKEMLTIPELAHGDYVKIAIRDEGVGIPEQYLKRIFDPYFTTKPKGNGLGLATTYSIIKHHKGLITVESEINAGSTFTIYLPAAERVEAPVETRRPTTTQLTGTGRVLIVDDEEAIRELVDFTLSHLGYEVATAESADAGLRLYRERFETGRRFDLVILDLTLPGGMSGKEALKRLIEIDPTVNAVVSSGYAMDATMSRYQEFGFRGVIAKPYEAAELAQVVREAIHSDQTPSECRMQAVG